MGFRFRFRLRVQGSGSRVQVSGCRVRGSGFIIVLDIKDLIIYAVINDLIIDLDIDYPTPPRSTRLVGLFLS